MNTGLLLQYIVIGVIVLASVLYAVRKFAPQFVNRGLAAATLQLDRPGRASWLRALARRIQPKQTTGNCSDGCSTCGACGSSPPASAKSDTMPLEFRPRRQ